MAIDPRMREACKHIDRGQEALDEAVGPDGINPAKLHTAALALRHAARILEGKVKPCPAPPPGGTETEGGE